MKIARRFDSLDNVGQSMYGDETNKPHQPYENYVDIYDFFKVLVDTLKTADVYSSWSEKETKDPTKLTLIQEFPDDLAPDSEVDSVVVYKLNKRYLNTDKNISAPGFVQRKPRTLESGYDLVSNSVKTDYANVFMNEIEFEVFSTSLIRLQETMQLLESFVFKYRGRLKLYVDNIIYDGQGPTVYNNAYFERTMFSKSLYLRVITYSQFSLLTEEIKEISSNIRN